MMFPFPKIDNNMILIVSVFLIIYVLTLKKAPLPVINKNIKRPVKDKPSFPMQSQNIITPTTVQNMPPGTTVVSNFTQRCANGRNVPPGSNCYDDKEEFTQNECPTLGEMLNNRMNKQQADFKKARDIGLPFPEGEGPSSQVNDYIGVKDTDWFNDSQYQTIQKIVEDPSRQMKASYGNVIPGGGDTRAWPETQPVNRTESALMLQYLPTKGNNVQRDLVA